MRRIPIPKVFVAVAVTGGMILANMPGLAQAADLRKAASQDSFISVWAADNPEREFQKAHNAKVWEAIQKADFPGTIRSVIEKQVPEDNLDQFDAVMEQVAKAVEPVDFEALAAPKQFLFQQFMEPAQFNPAMTYQVVMLELESGKATDVAAGLVNLMKMAEQASQGQLTVSETSVGGSTMHALQLPPQVPLSPNVLVVDDVLIFGTSTKHTTKCATLLSDGGLSKFDDPRVKHALTKLPKAEDQIIVFDARAMFSHLESIPDFIAGQIGDRNEEATKAIALVKKALSEFSCVDYEVTVGYTEDNRNCTAAYGRMLNGHENKLLSKMAMQNAPIKDWHKWVPAEAGSFTLNSGINLRPILDWAKKTIPEHIPDAQQGFDKLAEAEEQFEIDLAKDILDNLGGQVVSVTLPGGQITPLGQAGQGVSAMKCKDPARVKELLHRLVDVLSGIPQLEQQGIELVESEKLEGFEELNVNVFTVMGLRPIIGFKDGWMVVGTTSDAVQTVLDTQAGEHDSFLKSDAFAEMHMDTKGAVRSVSYSNLKGQTQAMAQGLRQMGILAPTFMAMAPPEAREQLAPVQELFVLLPKIANIVQALDFYENQMSITQDGDEPGSWIRNSVITIRPADEDASN